MKLLESVRKKDGWYILFVLNKLVNTLWVPGCSSCVSVLLCHGLETLPGCNTPKCQWSWYSLRQQLVLWIKTKHPPDIKNITTTDKCNFTDKTKSVRKMLALEDFVTSNQTGPFINLHWDDSALKSDPQQSSFAFRVWGELLYSWPSRSFWTWTLISCRHGYAQVTVKASPAGPVSSDPEGKTNSLH